MKYRTDLILGEAFCIFIFFYFLDSGLSVLNGLQFYFWLRDSENPQLINYFLSFVFPTGFISDAIQFKHFFGFGSRIATFIWWIFTGLNSLHSSKVQECMLNKLFYLCNISVQWFSCVRGTRTQPLICVGCSVLYWVFCAINKGGFFEIVFVVRLRVVPHFSSGIVKRA